MDRYKLLIYELWGNDEEGFWANDVFHVDDVFIPRNATDEEILHAVEAQNHVVIDQNSDRDFIEFYDTKKNCLIGRLELIA